MPFFGPRFASDIYKCVWSCSGVYDAHSEQRQKRSLVPMLVQHHPSTVRARVHSSRWFGSKNFSALCFCSNAHQLMQRESSLRATLSNQTEVKLLALHYHTDGILMGVRQKSGSAERGRKPQNGKIIIIFLFKCLNKHRIMDCGRPGMPQPVRFGPRCGNMNTYLWLFNGFCRRSTERLPMTFTLWMMNDKLITLITVQARATHSPRSHLCAMRMRWGKPWTDKWSCGFPYDPQAELPVCLAFGWCCLHSFVWIVKRMMCST